MNKIANLFIRTTNIGFIQKALLAYKKDLPRVVYYHIVSNSSEIPYYYKKNLFNESLLKEQLEWFLKNRYKFITLDEAVHLGKNNEKATKTIAFTTDDGFKENYEVMAPVFQKFGIKPTLFLISNCLNNKNLMWNNKIYYIKNKLSEIDQSKICNELSDKYKITGNFRDIVSFSDNWPMNIKEDIANDAWKLAGLKALDEFLEEHQPYMTNNQIKELINNGYHIGSHSASHPDFSKLSDDEVYSEMNQSKNAIKDAFGIDPEYFAYPYGIRPSLTIEKNLYSKNIYQLYFGVKSNLTNKGSNIFWERDKMEQDKEIGQFWFAAIPFIRNRVLHPFGKYK
jgi:peptidoglycan/xylan/chitin deacetylase (PgdA/CDA1 family)